MVLPKRLRLVAAAVLGACLDSALPSKPPRVTFVIDDARATDYTVKKPIFDAHHAVAVVAVPSRARELTDEQLRQLQADGWEIASHSQYHLEEVGLPDQQLDAEVAGSKIDLEAIGLTVTTYVYPFGHYDVRVQNLVSRYYEAGVTTSGGLNPLPVVDRYAIARYLFPYKLPWYQRLIEILQFRGAWLVIAVHELADTDVVNLGKLLEEIQHEQIPIVTIRQGLSY